MMLKSESRPAHRARASALGLGLAFVVSALLRVGAARADEPTETPPPAAASPEPPAPSAAPPPPPPPVAAEPANNGMVQADDQTEWTIGRMEGRRKFLELHGGLEMDVGYAKYTFDKGVSPNEEYFDFRGRFVFGPTLNYSFGSDYFVRARGEVVAWVREISGVYQLNVDDVYGQVGKRGVWDFKVGRFRPWRVYHKGYGFDLYTLEDTGALQKGPFDNQQFGPHTYEVSWIYNRETPGRAAFHLYPTTWSGVEVASTYGKDGVSNTGGVRGAGLLHWDFLRITGAAEYRFYRPAQDQTSTDSTGKTTTCDDCGIIKRYGGGGGAEVIIAPAGIMLGANFAQGSEKIYSPVNGKFDSSASGMTRSLGGYLEFDVGSLAMKRSLVLGGGFNRTERATESNDFFRHDQISGYIRFPLGFTDSAVKLVMSYADLTSAPVRDVPHDSKMIAGRVRLEYRF